MHWNWNPWIFDRAPFHMDRYQLGGLDIAGIVLAIILWAVLVTALVLAIRALILYGRSQTATARSGGPVFHPQEPRPVASDAPPAADRSSASADGEAATTVEKTD